MRKPGYWVRKLAKGTRGRVLDGLVARDVLHREPGKVLLVFPRTKYPAAHGIESPAGTDARTRLRAAVTRPGPSSGSGLRSGSGGVAVRTSALCALVAATSLDRKVFADLDRKQVKARLKEISEGSWAAAAVKKTIDEIQSAVMVAVIAASPERPARRDPAEHPVPGVRPAVGPGAASYGRAAPRRRAPR